MGSPKTIIGHGGGGKDGGSGGGGANEQSDTLFSHAYARVLDLICEGEIEGLANGGQSIFFDETPLQNANGTYNFLNVKIDTRNGTQGQSHIPGFASVENESQYDLEFTNVNPTTRTLTNSDLTAARVRISFPQLTQFTTAGDILGTSVQYAIDLQSNGGGFNEIVNKTVSGKSTKKYEISHRIELTGSPPWDIRVRRITPDNSTSLLSNRSYLAAIIEIVDVKLRYPNSALVGTLIDSAQFSRIPTRAFDMKLLRIKVPTNYDPATRIYTGTWDGTFKIAWSDNPAWCFYDLVTNNRYGLGQFLTSDQVDKWALYSIAQYCDQSVSNGMGGTEPRFTCNIYLQTRQEAYTVLNSMASIFRAIAFWAGGTIVASQDSPADAVHLYTNANVIDGLFNYQGASIKARHTVALVTWNDPTDFYRQKVEYVEDADAIARYGVVQSQVIAVGCTSKGQAHRVGRWLLYSERLESETVMFQTGLEAAIGRPGQIIKIADKNRSGSRIGGRLISATSTQVVLDAAVTLSPGVEYTLSILTDAGTVVDRVVTTAASTTNTLDVGVAFDAAPSRMMVWTLASNNVQPQTFRVISLAEPQRGTYEITALAHNASKYDAVENNLVLEVPQISSLKAMPDAPTNLSISEALYEASGGIEDLVTFAWSASDLAKKYQVTYTVDNGNPITVETQATELELRAARTGLYSVQVRAVSVIGVKSVPATATAVILGKTAAPADLTNFTITVFNGVAQFVWDLHPDLDVRVGGKIDVRYSTLTDGTATWSNGVSVGEFPGGSTSGLAPLLNGTYLAKAVDSSGNFSVNAQTAQTDIAKVLLFNAVATDTESPGFAGTKTSIVYDGLSSAIYLENATKLDDYGLIDSIIFWDAEGGITPTGSYFFSNYIDLTATYTSRVTATITAQAFDSGDVMDVWGLLDDRALMDGGIINDAGAQLFVSTTKDDPAGTPTWSAWVPFTIGDYTARAFQFRLDLTHTQPTTNIRVTGLSVTVDMPDRVEAGRSVTVPVTGLTINFSAAFNAIPAIAITARDLATGDYMVKSAESKTGFNLIFNNAAGSPVQRVVDWVAKGYGYLH